MPKPTEKPYWATSSVNDPLTGAPNKEQPSGEFQTDGLNRREPLLRSHLNWMFDNISKWIDYLETTISTIVLDKTIYVATTGNDTTGDGTIGAPYATPHAALASLDGVPIAGGTTVTIFIAAGLYNLTTPIVVNHPYGERIHITGDTMTGNMPFGVPIANWSNRNSPIVPARGIDEFYNSAGTLPVNAAAVTREAAIQSDLTNNRALLNTRFGTRLQFTGSSGLQVQGNNSLGLFNNIMLEGDWDGTNVGDPESFYGIDSGESTTAAIGTPLNVSGGTVYVGDNVAVIGFRGDGLRARYGGMIACNEGMASVNNLDKGFNASYFGGIVANRSTAQGNGAQGYLAISTGFLRAEEAVSSGNYNQGFQASTGASIRIKGAQTYGNRTNGVLLSINSSASMDNVITKGNGTEGLRLVIGSACDADNVDSSDNGSDGIGVLGSTFSGKNLVCDNNAANGLDVEDNSSATITNSDFSGNSGDDIFARRNSSVNAGAGTIASGGSVSAYYNSYISIANIGGVTYSPSHGSVGNNEALISS
tara:strand:- start:23926 stop:25527 length:1602 start_codon:yes stop_codon:yes gene_type:complete